MQEFDATTKAIVEYLADDYIHEKRLGYRDDVEVIKNSFVDSFSYSYSQLLQNRNSKEFLDAVINKIPGFDYGYFIKSLDIAQGSCFDLAMYLQEKKKEEKSKDSEKEKQKRIQENLEKRVNSALNKLDEDNEDNEDNEDSSNQNIASEQESNIIYSLAESEIEDLVKEEISEIGGKNASKDKSQPYQLKDLVQKIIRYTDNLETLKKSLKNISAISDAILMGLEKTETQQGDIGYVYGRDLRNVDARDLALLNSSQTADIFKLKYTKGELLQETNLEGKGIGDLVFCVDTSGSTASFVKNEQYAKTETKVLHLELAIAIGMAKYVVQNKARARMLLFNEASYFDSGWLRNNTEIKHFLHTSLVQKLEMGGTCFDSALIAAKSVLESHTHAKNKPGIVFITDGYDLVHIGDEIRQLKSATKAKLYSYFVSDSNPTSLCPSLTQISDKINFIDHKLDVIEQMQKFTVIKN